jgi:hypothetical protein
LNYIEIWRYVTRSCKAWQSGNQICSSGPPRQMEPMPSNIAPRRCRPVADTPVMPRAGRLEFRGAQGLWYRPGVWRRVRAQQTAMRLPCDCKAYPRSTPASPPRDGGQILTQSAIAGLHTVRRWQQRIVHMRPNRDCVAQNRALADLQSLQIEALVGFEKLAF